MEICNILNLKLFLHDRTIIKLVMNSILFKLPEEEFLLSLHRNILLYTYLLLLSLSGVIREAFNFRDDQHGPLFLLKAVFTLARVLQHLIM